MTKVVVLIGILLGAVPPATAQTLRVALTGKTVSPGIDEVMVTLGKERVIERIQRAIAHIGAANCN